MKKLLMLVTILLAGPSFAGPSSEAGFSAKAVETVSLDPEWTAPILGGGVKSNGEFTDANLFFLYPWNNTVGKGGNMEGSMFFLEPYGLWAEHGEAGASLGLGFRRLFSKQSVSDAKTDTNPGLLGEGVYVGANVFIDYGRTSDNNDFWQAGFGLELGSRYLEIRGNYYLPLSDDKVIGSGVVTSAGTRSGFEIYEEALEGWDVELAVLVPGLDKYMDVQLIAGYYGYDGDRSSNSDFEGWRAGVEARPVPNLVFGVTWFEKEQIYQENWLASFSVELPWGGMGEMLGSAFRPRRRHLAERMFKIVRRKNSALTYVSNCDPPSVSCQITDIATAQPEIVNGAVID